MQHHMQQVHVPEHYMPPFVDHCMCAAMFEHTIGVCIRWVGCPVQSALVTRVTGAGVGQDMGCSCIM
jgi:hypothetical protein